MRQLGIVGEQRVVILGAPSMGPWTGWKISKDDLATLLAGVDHSVDVVAFVHGDQVDRSIIEAIEDMVGTLSADDALVSTSLMSDAVKEVRDGFIVRNVDRSNLVVAVPPAVIRRSSLERALEGSEGDFIDPVNAVANSGGVVRFRDRS